MILLCKVLLAPGFVIAITLAMRRFGPRVGGILGGLPVVAGPILFIYAIDHGTRFAASAASNSVAALAALTAFVVVLAATSERWGAVRGVLFGWVAFCAVAAVIAAAHPPPVAGLGASCLAITAALRWFPKGNSVVVDPSSRRPPFDLAIRAGAVAGMVLLLTSIAGALGPAASGALTPFPSITSVLAGFAVAHETRATGLQLLRGMLRGYYSFAAALFVIAVTVEPWGIALSFFGAIAITTIVQFTLLAAGRRSSPIADPAAA